MDPSGDHGSGWFHWASDAVLLFLSGLLSLFVKDLRSSIEKKADKEVVALQLQAIESKVTAIKELGETRAKRMEEHHAENSGKLNDIIRELRVR